MSRYVGVLSPRHGRHLLRIFARFAGWSYDEHHLIDVCRPRLRWLRPEVVVSDVSFRSQNHDQTRQDGALGAESFDTAAQAAREFADAQVADVWGTESGVEAARQALQDAYNTAREGFASEGDKLRDFDRKVVESEDDFKKTEDEVMRKFKGEEANMASIPFLASLVSSLGVPVHQAAGTLNTASTTPSSSTYSAGSQDSNNPVVSGSSDF